MKRQIRDELMSLATQMPLRRTGINAYYVSSGNNKFKGKSTISANFAKMKFKAFPDGVKPVNNFITLKKAYRLGGIEQVRKTLNHYKQNHHE